MLIIIKNGFGAWRNFKLGKKLGVEAFGDAFIAKDNTSRKKSQLKLKIIELSNI